MTTFLFRFPLPPSCPSSINFGSGLAIVRYEVRATVGVAYKGENKLVFDKTNVDVVEAFELDFSRVNPEAVVVGESGKIWLQAKLSGGVVVAGQPACVELTVKNHSSKKVNTFLGGHSTFGLTTALEHRPQSFTVTPPPFSKCLSVTEGTISDIGHPYHRPIQGSRLHHSPRHRGCGKPRFRCTQELQGPQGQPEARK